MLAVNIQVIYSTNTGSGLTWTQRSWLSCHNTCHWTTTTTIMMSEAKLNLYDKAQFKKQNLKESVLQ
nr:hypothetical protein CFP56_35341 [Quercus suber]